MDKVSLLSRQRHTDRQRDKSAATPAEQASRLTHTIMNQLTIVYLSCSRLRRSLGADPSLQQDSDIQIIESAVEKIATQTEALRFRLEKTSRPQVKARSGKPQKQHGAKTKVSFISPRGIEKT
jgi:nitrogen fixation/metabolism regulation signal transduction histidine kinase